MPLSWNEIKARAAQFSRDWKSASDERSQGQEFWIAFFDIFDVKKPRIASFEHAVKKHGGSQGFIDLFWPGMLLVEHKSRGKNLERAHAQAMDYFPGLKERDLPRYVLVSDFARMRLFDLEGRNDVEFTLADLPKHIKRFAFVAGYKTQQIKPQDPVNIKAAEKMGALHDALKAGSYSGHPLEMLLVRLLFCLFADDTGIFQPAQSFRAWVEERTANDGSDLGPQLALLFQVLNTPPDQRSRKLDEQLLGFEYINGRLFEEALPLAAFDAAMRDQLLECCALDWSAISPAIFGAMFQSIMDAKARRNVGAHYTSEENILKLIKPLFLDELWAEFQKVKGNRNRLFEFHKKLRTLNYLDPACGCGNFLVITYRELRLLELEVLRSAYGSGQQVLDVHQLLRVDVDQFYGIEIEEFPAQIAQVALWLIDHQMNVRVSDEFGAYYARIPLKATPHIVNGNALRIDWVELLASERCSFVLGNPPFVGAMVMSDAQREDVAHVFADLKGYGVLDLVACWYWKAAKYIQASSTDVAFVSTNSITQGEQVGLLWAPLMHRFALRIIFAHRTFRWSNEARGVAAVHCVIVGFSRASRQHLRLFDYDNVAGPPHGLGASNINAYLVDAPDVFLINRATPICAVPSMRFGSMPRDGGNLVLEKEEFDHLLAVEPQAAKWIRPYTGAQEFLNGLRRWCLWLVDAPPAVLRALPEVMNRVRQVKKFRLESKAESTRRFASTPTLFCQIAQPETDYLLVPRVSSERRMFVPMGFVEKSVIGNDQVLMVPDVGTYHFGILSSTIHNAWVRSHGEFTHPTIHRGIK